jgi:hypothetical protein
VGVILVPRYDPTFPPSIPRYEPFNGVPTVTSLYPSQLYPGRNARGSAKMVSMIVRPRIFLVRSFLALALVGPILFGIRVVRAQGIPMLPRDLPEKKHKLKDKFPEKPSQVPSFTIPVGPLGYALPGVTYLGRHYSLVNLSFLDENRLLFSFRAPGLLQREPAQDEPEHERQMRAVVLKLPDGTKESDATWMLPDLKPYLWMLKDGHYLLRDLNGIEAGDASLQMKPLFRPSGEFLSMRIDPAGKFLLASSVDPAAHFDADAPGTRKVLPLKPQIGENTEPANIAARLVQIDSGQVLHTKRATSAAKPPINSESYLEITHDKLDQWSLKLNGFGGESKIIGHVESTCLPSSFFLSEREILVAGCDPDHRWKLTAVTTDWRQVWEFPLPNSVIPPLFEVSSNGSRFVRETIALKQTPQADSETLWVKDVRGQVVRVFDAADGKLVLEQPLNPVLDAGGNVAISPSGKRVAILNGKTIEVFDLPDPAPLPKDVAH